MRKHSEALDDEARTKAAEYILKAPSQIKSDYRSELERLAFIREQKSRLHD